MRATRAAPLASEGDPSLEIRWIMEGGILPGMIEWLGPLTAPIEERRDSYLVGLTGPCVGVKIRGGMQLDVKVFAGSPGILSLPGRADGPLQWWRKWSYPLPPRGEDPTEAGWSNMWKTRRIRFFSIEGRPIPPGERADHRGACAIELTEVTLERTHWWTLGIEATGPERVLADALDASAAFMFARPLPAGLRLDRDRATSYPE